MKRLQDTFWNAFHGQGRASFWTEVGVNLLILVSFGGFVYEQFADLTQWDLVLLARLELTLLLLFSVEALLRVWSYRPELLNLLEYRGLKRLEVHIFERLKFCLRPWMLIDILTVISFLPQLRGVRALRLLRLVRFVRLFRYSNPFRRLARALSENRLQFILGFFFLLVTTFVGGLAGFLFEYEHNAKIDSFADAFWWALVTLTTVGYGDIVPVTGLGRLVGGILMLAGMMNLGLFAAIVGFTLPKALMQVREEQALLSSHLNHWVVCGYESGSEMFLSLLTKEIDEDTTVLLMGPGERPDGVSSRFVWVEGDPQKEDQLHKARLPFAAGVVLIAPRSLSPQQADATTILTAFTIRSFLQKNPLDHRRKPLFMVSEVLDGENKEHLLTAGVDEVVETNRLGFSLISHALKMPGTARLMGTLAAFEDFSFYVGFDSSFGDEISFGDLSIKLKHKHHILLVGFRREGDNEVINPENDVMVKSTDTLIYLSQKQVLDR